MKPQFIRISMTVEIMEVETHDKDQIASAFSSVKLPIGATNSLDLNYFRNALVSEAIENAVSNGLIPVPGQTE